MSSLFGWSEKYSLEIKEIDQQHKKLIGMISKLHEAMRNREGRQVTGVVLKELIDYTRDHFAFEERLMKTHSYPEYEQHKTKHGKMTRKVLDIQRGYEEGKLSINLELMKFLEDWVDKHILGTDMKYAPFLKSMGIQ